MKILFPIIFIDLLASRSTGVMKEDEGGGGAGRRRGRRKSVSQTRTRKQRSSRRRKSEPRHGASPLRHLPHLLSPAERGTAAARWTFSLPVCGALLPARSRCILAVTIRSESTIHPVRQTSDCRTRAPGAVITGSIFHILFIKCRKSPRERRPLLGAAPLGGTAVSGRRGSDRGEVNDLCAATPRRRGDLKGQRALPRRDCLGVCLGR